MIKAYLGRFNTIYSIECLDIYTHIWIHLECGVWCTALLFDTFGYHISFTITKCVLPDLHFSRPNVELVASL